MASRPDRCGFRGAGVVPWTAALRAEVPAAESGSRITATVAKAPRVVNA